MGRDEMATIIERNGKFQAQLCIRGKRHARTFTRRPDAVRWAMAQEQIAETGVGPEYQLWTLGRLCDAFISEEAPKKADWRHYVIKLNWWKNSKLGKLRLIDITPNEIEDFKEQRLTEVQPATVRRDLVFLQSCLSWAVRKRYMPSNPCREVKKPPDSLPRERIAEPGDIERLRFAAGWTEGKPQTATARTVAAFILSCKTGMRGGEICQIRKHYIDFNKRVITLPAEVTKTRKRRAVAFGKEAAQLLADVVSLGLDPVFGIDTVQRDALFRKVRDMAGLGDVVENGMLLKQGLHFHDGRATFCTWAASPGEDGSPRLDVLSLAKQVGHQNIRQLMTYYRPKPEDLAKRL